jgi:hypothetical protein
LSSFWLGEHVTDAPESITPQLLELGEQLCRLGDGVDIGLDELLTAPAVPVNEPGLPKTATCFCTAVVLIGYRRVNANADTDSVPSMARRTMSRRVRSASARKMRSARSSLALPPTTIRL